MIRIDPVKQDDAGTTYAEVFASTFSNQRLGKAGTWQGIGAERLRLQNPVTPQAFVRLLHGRTIDGRKSIITGKESGQRVLGWRFTLSVSPNLSALWALVDRATRVEIERMFLSSVRGPLQSMEKALSRWDWSATAPRGLHPGALFAKFRAGATTDQRPQLHTTVFLFNLAFGADGKMTTFSANDVRRQAVRMNALSEKILGFSLWNGLGISLQYLDMERNSLGMPRGPSLKFFCDPSFTVRTTPKPGEPSKALPSEELFAAWQRKAQEWDWGPKQARRYIKHAKQIRQALLLDTQIRHRAFEGTQALTRARDSVKRLLAPTKKDRMQKQRSSDRQQLRISY